MKLLSQIKGFPENNCDFFKFMITSLPRMESAILEIPCQYNLSAPSLHHRCVGYSSAYVHHNFPPGSTQTGPVHLICRSELAKLCGSIFQSEQTPVSTPVLNRIYPSPALSLKNSWSYTSTPPYAFMVCTGTALTLSLLSLLFHTVTFISYVTSGGSRLGLRK